MLARTQSASVDLSLFNHLLVGNSESYSENSGFIRWCEKMINLWKSGTSQHLRWLGIVLSCPVSGADVVYLVLKSLCQRNRQGNHKLKLLFVCVCVHVHVHVHAYTGTQWEMGVINEDVYGPQ